MQSLTRNPLADPYLLGLSSGASLGAVAVLVVGVSLLLPVAAFAGALLALVATLALARTGGTLAPGRTVLAGLAVSQLAAAGHQLRHLLDRHGRLLPRDPQLAARLAGGSRRGGRSRSRASRCSSSARSCSLSADAARRVRLRGHVGGRARHRRRPHALDADDRRRAAHGRDGRGERRDRLRRPDPAARGLVADRARAPAAPARRGAQRRRVPGLGGHARAHAVRPARAAGRHRHGAHRRARCSPYLLRRGKGSAWT